jgi:hypothetical protein
MRQTWCALKKFDAYVKSTRGEVNGQQRSTFVLALRPEA